MNDAGVQMNFSSPLRSGKEYRLRFEILQSSNVIVSPITKGTYAITASTREHRYTSPDDDFIFHVTESVDTSRAVTLRVAVEAASTGLIMSIGSITQNFTFS